MNFTDIRQHLWSWLRTSCPWRMEHLTRNADVWIYGSQQSKRTKTKACHRRIWNTPAQRTMINMSLDSEEKHKHLLPSRSTYLFCHRNGYVDCQYAQQPMISTGNRNNCRAVQVAATTPMSEHTQTTWNPGMRTVYNIHAVYILCIFHKTYAI